MATTIRFELSSCLALCVVSFIFYKLISTNKRLKAPPLPPGPTAYPIIGSLLQMATNKPTFRWIHNLMQELNTEIACIRLGGVHVISVASPELSMEFLKKQDAIFASRPNTLSSRLTSGGYLTLALSPAGDQWRKMRKVMVSEVLSASVHRQLHTKRCEEANHLVRYVYNQCGNSSKTGLVNVKEVAQHYCGSLIRNLVFSERLFGVGAEDGGPGFEEREHTNGLFTILSILYGFSIADFLPWLEILDLDGHKETITNGINNARKYQDPRIENRIEMRQKGIKREKDDILDILINLKNSENKPLLSVREIKALILEIMVGTIDNPSNAVEWALAEMINQPDIIANACEELDRVVGKDRLVQESDLPRLNYVKACLRESFRLHPLSPFNLPHVSSVDTIVGGYFIPKGSYVVISRLGLGRNPRTWVDPLKFNPDRHIVDEVSTVVLQDHELKMLSFSIGRRSCPGVELGSTMSMMLLARLIQGFNWKPPFNMTSIGLADESGHDLALPPYVAHATPRLDSKIYQELMTN